MQEIINMSTYFEEKKELFKGFAIWVFKIVVMEISLLKPRFLKTYTYKRILNDI